MTRGSLRRRLPVRPILLSVGIALATQTAWAVELIVDYTYDSPAMGGIDFFGAGNPNGAAGGDQARAVIEAAAGYFSYILADSFSPIDTPDEFVSAIPVEDGGGTAEFQWQMEFNSPGDGQLVTLVDQSIGANEYRIYVGARDLGQITLAEGGRGADTRSIVVGGGGLFTPSEAALVTATRDAFFDAVDNRGEPGFGAWGGSISFSNAVNIDWNFNHNQLPGSSQIDFYSVAVHELTHTLGFAGSAEWEMWISGDPPVFDGPNASTSNGGDSVPLDEDLDHWEVGVDTTVFGTDDMQLSMMDRVTLDGTRQLFGTIDAAALADIGWDFGTIFFNPADFNADLLVNGVDVGIWEASVAQTAAADADGDLDSDGADFLVWQRQLGSTPASGAALSAVPEPLSLGTAVAALLLVVLYAAAPRLMR